MSSTIHEPHSQRRVTPPKPRNAVRRDIQGLRALAVIVVILNHMLGWPSGGFIGVDVFFVLSGYLITGLLLREHDRSGTISFTGFYRRRVKRILPAALLVLVVTVAASYVLTPGVRFVRTAVDSFWALVFSANWNLAIQGTDYFQRDLQPSPVQHYWSLAVEEQFYFVWPWLMLGLLALGVRQFAWSRGSRRLAVGIAIGVISVASFTYAVVLTSTDMNLAYFSSLDRAWELGAGALIAVFGTYFTAKSVLLRTVMSWAGFVAIIAACFLVDPAAGFPAPAAALPVVATALVLLAGERGGQPYLWPLTNRASQYVGDLSYSLYLWHFPVLILLLAVIPGDNIVYYLIASGIIVLVSVLSYHFVEDPIRKSTWLNPRERLSSRARRRKRSRRRAFFRTTVPKVAMVAALAIVAVGLIYVAFVRTDHVAAPSAATQQTAAPADEATGAVDDGPDCWGAAKMDPASGCADVDLGQDLRPSAADAVDDKMTVSGKSLCWIKLTGDAKPCHYGPNGPDSLKVALVGDSHAQHLLPALIELAPDANWSIDAYVGEGCLLSTRPSSTCGDMQPKILDAVIAGDYDMVLTQSARTKGNYPEGFVETFQKVQSSGAQVVAITDIPAVSEEAILCYQRVGFNPGDNTCGTPLSDSAPDPVTDAAGVVPGVHVVDLTSFFCTDGFCPSVIGNVPVYRDSGGHITQTFAKSLSPYLASAVQSALGTPTSP